MGNDNGHACIYEHGKYIADVYVYVHTLVNDVSNSISSRSIFTVDNTCNIGNSNVVALIYG